MKGIEIDFVVKDCLQAIDLYQRIFEVENIQATSLEKGLNEVLFSIYGAHFHILDENPEFQLFAPDDAGQVSFWFNVTVEDIETIYQCALESGCTEIQPITYMENFGVSNAMFKDPFGYIWMLHSVKKVT